MARLEPIPSVLVVVDDRSLLETMADVLTTHGCPVVGCASDTVGASQLLRHRPNVALVDYQLRDGPCDSLLHMLADGGVKFAVLSGYSSRDLPASMRRHHHLGKPFGAWALLDTVHRLNRLRHVL